MLKMKDLDLFNKRVLIRLDLNVPINNGLISSDKRIKLSIPTINMALKKGAKVILASHLGRPKEGYYDSNYSLLPVVNCLKKYLNIPIKLVKNYLESNIFFSKKKNEIIMLENVRFNKGESKNSLDLAKKYSKLCDIFVMDAFATSHRIHSSTYGIIKYSKSCIGPLFYSEIKYLSKAMFNPIRPMVVIIGGAKVSTKFNVLNYLSKIADTLIVGGGISNTFISVNNFVGKSLHEPSYIPLAKKLIDKYNIPVPTDCRLGKSFSKDTISYVKDVSDIKEDEEIMDLGDDTLKRFCKIIVKAKTILWNGPVGVFEFPNFSKGTKSIINAILNSDSFSIVGGGDTISALEYFGSLDKVSYVSSGGGSFLKFIEGKELPVISILKKNLVLFN